MAGIDTAALLASVNIVDVLLAHGIVLKQRGNEYITRCINPHHPDENPSMCVVPLKQRVHCFSCGYSEDAIGVTVTLSGGNARDPSPAQFNAACEELGSTQIQSRDNWAAITPEEPLNKALRITTAPPPGVMRPDMALKHLGEPVHVAIYRDKDGVEIGYIARYNEINKETGEAKKTYRPWTYGRRSVNLANEWAMGSFSSPTPLYNADLLAQRPGAPACIVEGEKTADAARQLLPDYVCITWPGGAMAAQHVDWEAIKGRSIVIFPDADFVGQKASEWIAKRLVELGVSLDDVIVVDTSEQPQGWDLADALAEGWTTEKLLAWAKARKLAISVRRNGSPMREVTRTDTDTDASPPNNVVYLPPRAVDLVVHLPPQFSEASLANAWSESSGKDWRYTNKLGLWHFWDGKRWQPDEGKTVVHAAKQQMIAAVNWPGATILSEAQRRALCGIRTIHSVISMASADPRHATTPAEWDASLELLGTPDGIVNLKTGERREAQRDDKITRLTAVAPQDGPTPVWDKVVSRASRDCPEVLDYLQRWCGYLLTGETREEAFLFIHGQGGSGKSKFINTIQEILGGYAKSTAMDAFVERRNAAHLEEIARLAGARMVCATETEEGSRWNESRIKTLTGREVVAARHMYQATFEFTPQFKIVIGGNHHPHLKSVGEEMRRRIHLIEFPGSIPASERILDLPQKLQAEYPQILAWMIRGAVAWYERGLTRPKSVLDYTDSYLRHEDVAGDWMASACKIGPEKLCLLRVAYLSYSTHVVAVGERAPTQKQFVAKMESRGFTRTKRGDVNFLSGFEMLAVESDGDFSF